MLVTNVRTMGMQETLRSLGAVLDEHRAKSVCILEVEAGLLVRAAVLETHEDDGRPTWQPLERLYPDNALFQQQVAGVARRGTGHEAGTIERTLRLIGRQVDDRSAKRLTIIQHHSGDGWLVWHDGPDGDQTHLFAMSTDELLTLDEQLRAAARGTQLRVTADV